MNDDLFDTTDAGDSSAIDGARRPLDRTEIIVGGAFAVLGVLFWADLGSDFDFDAGYVWPILLIAFGVAGLLSGRDRD